MSPYLSGMGTIYGRRRQSGIPIFYLQSAAPFAGLADVVASPAGYWGLRSVSLAGIGGNVVNIRRSSDNTTKTFVSIAGGGINTGDAFFDGSNYFVHTLFDQSGNANDLTQATNASQPVFLLSGGANSHPVISFTTSTWLQNTNFLQTISQAFSVSHVVNVAAAQSRDLFRCTTGGGDIAYNGIVPNHDIYTPNVAISVAALDGAYHAIQTVFNSSSSAVMVDGTDSTGLTLSGGFSTSGQTLVLNDQPQSTAMNCLFEEIAIWPTGIGFTNTQRTNLNSNERSYWGF